MFNWRAFLDQHRIPYVTEGLNTPRGSLGIRCPFCGEADPSQHMVLRPFGNYWHCWRDRSHRGGNPAKLVQALLGCSLARAYDLTAEARGPSLTKDWAAQTAANLLPASLIEPPRTMTKFPSWPKEFRPFADEYAARPFLEYLSKRGFHKLARNPALITPKYKIHYCVSGPFKGRIIFPVVQSDNLISWTGRSIYPSEKQRYKSLTTDQSKADVLGLEPAAAPLNHALLWQDDLANATGTLVITEGPFDALKVRVLGEQDNIHATCLFTSMPTNKQFALIRRLCLQFEQTIVLLDEDAMSKSLVVEAQLATTRGKTKQAWLTQGDPGDLHSKDQLLALLEEHMSRIDRYRESA